MLKSGTENGAHVRHGICVLKSGTESVFLSRAPNLCAHVGHGIRVLTSGTEFVCSGQARNPCA